MSEEYYYSAENNGFYPLVMKGDYDFSQDGWPKDAIAISDEDYMALLAGQAEGKIILAGSNGFPVLSEPPELTKEQEVTLAEEYKSALMSEATLKISPLQDAIDLDIIKGDGELELRSWKQYRYLLSRVDVSNAPDIKWPNKPQ